MTSAKQGPWTDIYGLSATLYHAITGQTPPSAFDRMLDDAYEPLGQKALPEFARGLLAGIDTGLAVRASDRPQSIAGWRPILGQAAAPDADATMALARTSAPAPPAVALRIAEPSAKKRGIGLWIGAAAALLVILAGGYYALVDGKRETPQAAAVLAPSPVEKAAQDAQLAAEAQRLKDQEELARLRTEAAAREKAEQEAAQRRQIEEETRRRIEAEMAEKKRLEDETRQKAALDAADRQRQQDEARQKAEADAAAEKRAAETAENGLRLTTLDRQHVQVALAALGFGSAGTDGTFGGRTREMIAAWQKTHNNPPTGYLTGTQNQALLRDAAPAVSRFDEEQKKAATPPPPPPPAAPAQVAAVAPPPAATTPPAPAASGTAAAGDGTWQGTYDCQAGRDAAAAPPFTAQFRAMVTNGHGVWVPPVSRGTLSIALQITGDSVRLTRTVANPDQTKSDTYLTGKLSGASITASGHEQPFGRNCTVVLGRIDTPAGVHPSGGGGGAGTGGGAHRRPRN
ncbi:MAG TPA: peptidoglycan-binding protein, partial [Reyranella sp.]